jgi:micrococcal nuclease
MKTPALKICLLLVIMTNSYFSFSQNKTRVVTRVPDGDTVVLENGERVRLIGINAPEMNLDKKYKMNLGKDSRDFLYKLAGGKQVTLKYDLQRKDKYGRTLAYLYLSNGTNINAELIKSGQARVFTEYPFRKKDEFLKYQKTARSKSLGIWKPGTPYVKVDNNIVENKNLSKSNKIRKKQY